MKYAKKAKHTLAFLTAAMLTFQPVSALAVTFADLNQVPWAGAETSIQKAADLGLIVGETRNGKSYFKPKDPVSLTEACQFAYKVMLETDKAYANAATVEKWSIVMNTYNIQSWAHPAVSYCLENGIIHISDLSGFVSNGVNKSATREQAAEILGRALEVGVPSAKATATATKFVDNSSISVDARPYIALLNTNGIVNGDDLNKFNPKSTLNRTETAVMVTNLYSVLNNAVSTPVSTSAKGTLSTLTKYYLNLEGSSSYYFFPLTGSTTATLNGSSSSVDELVTLFKSGAKMDAELTLTGNNEITKIVVTSEDVKELDLSGKITSLSDSKIKIDSSSYDIKDKNKVTVKIDGSTKTFSTLLSQYKDKTEFEATVTLDDDGYVSKIDAKAKKSSTKGDVTGELTDIDTQNGSDYEASIELDDEDIYYIEDESDLVVEINGSKKDFDDLRDVYNELDSDEELDVTLVLDPSDSDYVTKIILDSSLAEDEENGIITDVDEYDLELDDSYDYEIDDSTDIDITDGDNSDIDDLDELILAFEEGKVMDVVITIEDDYVTDIKGEVVEVTGTLIDITYGSSKYTLTMEIDDEEYEYTFSGDAEDTDVVSVSGYGDSMEDFYDDFVYEAEEIDDITLKLENDKIKEVKD